MQEKLAALGLKLGSPYILVNPNASDLLIERRWPERHMAQAVTQLAELGHNVVLMGAKSEASFVQGLCDRVTASARERVWNSAGLLSLSEAFALIEGASCVLSNDTGPMHMAFALGRPTVCLFGPVDPAHYGIGGPNIVTFYAPVPCSPCVHEIDKPPCDGNNVCMQRLLPGPVVQQVLAQIARAAGDPVRTQPSPTGGETLRLPLVWETDTGQPLGIVIRSWTNYR
jgi:ADP-heptose:LPS heptosyltransferase